MRTVQDSGFRVGSEHFSEVSPSPESILGTLLNRCISPEMGTNMQLAREDWHSENCAEAYKAAAITWNLSHSEIMAAVPGPTFSSSS